MKLACNKTAKPNNGGEGAYNELLDCFEKAGIELRPEIDEYFAKFNR